MRRKIEEAIIDWRGQGLEEFAGEVYSRRLPIFADEFTSIAQEYGIEVVDYQTFYAELPEEHKAGAPPRGVSAFALINPNTFRPRIVLNVQRIDQRLFDYILHMLKHEMVHVGQYSRRTKHPSGAWDVRDRGAYFSQTDEIMAFSHSIADQLIAMGARQVGDIHHMLKRVPLYNDVKRHVSARVLKRYLKYIYLYLERELESDQAFESFSSFIAESAAQSNRVLELIQLGILPDPTYLFEEKSDNDYGFSEISPFDPSTGTIEIIAFDTRDGSYPDLSDDMMKDLRLDFTPQLDVRTSAIADLIHGTLTYLIEIDDSTINLHISTQFTTTPDKDMQLTTDESEWDEVVETIFLQLSEYFDTGTTFFNGSQVVPVYADIYSAYEQRLQEIEKNPSSNN